MLQIDDDKTSLGTKPVTVLPRQPNAFPPFLHRLVELLLFLFVMNSLFWSNFRFNKKCQRKRVLVGPSPSPPDADILQDPDALSELPFVSQSENGCCTN